MQTVEKKFSPETTILLWDLHEVLFEKSRLQWVWLCLKFNRRRELLFNLDRHILRILFSFILERLCLAKKELVSEELLNAARAANNHALVELVTTVSSAYTPIKPTVELLKELSALGYTHHIGSNIGKTVFEHCQGKFNHVFSEFTQATIPFYAAEKNIIKKPNPHFFVTHLEKNNLHAKNIIFIDDKKMNIDAAQSVGIHAIQFKNAEQLKKDLTGIGLL